jgi:hypothetical protein
MHPFDHRPDTPIINGKTYNEWVEKVNQNYLDICHDKTVLEIASGEGLIGQKILDHRPRQLTLIDPAPVAKAITGAEFISDDVSQWLNQYRPMDVVICFGYLFHIHNSLQLIESIVNYCNPETIILDNVIAPHPLAFNEETIGRPNNRYVRQNWKYSPYNLAVPFFIINKSLDHMGYSLVKTHKLKFEIFPKTNGWVASWQKR